MGEQEEGDTPPLRRVHVSRPSVHAAAHPKLARNSIKCKLWLKKNTERKKPLSRQALPTDNCLSPHYSDAFRLRVSSLHPGFILGFDALDVGRHVGRHLERDAQRKSAILD